MGPRSSSAVNFLALSCLSLLEKRDEAKTVNTDHTHTCCKCGFEYECIYYDLESCKRKGVFKAMQVNHDGPYCNLCQHLEMARRFAEHRGLKLRWPRVPRHRKKKARRRFSRYNFTNSNL